MATAAHSRDQLTEVSPVLERPDAIVFGRHDYVELQPNQILCLAQVRQFENPELPRLADDIEANDLMNPIDVTLLTEEQLQTYLDFVNHTWGTETTLEDCSAFRRPDGMYWLCIAGHTRLAAIERIAERKDPDIPVGLVAKVHWKATTPEAIVRLQLAENTHNQPSRELQAKAIVELYRWGLEVGDWNDGASFKATLGQSVKGPIVKAALAFNNLPVEAMNFVFNGLVPYQAAVILGGGTETLFRFTAANMGYHGHENEAPGEAMQLAYNLEVLRIFIHIRERRLSNMTANHYVAAQLKNMAQHLRRLDLDKAREDNGESLWGAAVRNEQEDAQLWHGTTDEERARYQTNRYLHDLQKKAELAKREMEASSLERVLACIALAEALGREDDVKRLREEFARHKLKFNRIGAVAVEMW